MLTKNGARYFELLSGRDVTLLEKNRLPAMSPKMLTERRQAKTLRLFYVWTAPILYAVRVYR